jgi:mycoredoxin
MADDKGIVFYGTSWCPDCIMARQVLDQQGVSYQLIDIDRDPAASAYVVQVNRGFRSVPTIVFPDGSILVEPSRSELMRKLSARA